MGSSSKARLHKSDSDPTILFPLSYSIWTVDLAHLLRNFGLEVQYTTLTIGTNPGFSGEAFYGQMQDDAVRVDGLFQVAF